MSLRQRLRRLQAKAEEGGVLIHQQDGSIRRFEVMDVYAEMFLAKMDLFSTTARESEVLEAVRNATPQSRREFEEKFGAISFSEFVIASDAEGGWVDRYELTPDGRATRIRYEGGSEEAVFVREAVQARTMTSEITEQLARPPVAGRLLVNEPAEDLSE